MVKKLRSLGQTQALVGSLSRFTRSWLRSSDALSKCSEGRRSQILAIQQTGRQTIEVVIVDLSSLKDIMRATEGLLQRHSHLNVLVNNAGLYSSRYQESADGFELTFAVNHLAVQLLTNQLMPLLEAGATAEPARIVNVASEAHRRGKVHWNDVNLKSAYGSMAAYSQSKLANILHALHFSTAICKRNISSIHVILGSWQPLQVEKAVFLGWYLSSSNGQ